MDSFFGIGLSELIFILILAGLVMGPHRIRMVARTLGRVTAQLQGISREFARQLNNELDSLDDSGDMKSAMREVRELQQEVKNLRQEMKQVPRSFIQEGKDAVEEGRAVLDGRDSYKPVSRQGEEQENGVGASLPKAINVPEDPE